MRRLALSFDGLEIRLSNVVAIAAAVMALLPLARRRPLRPARRPAHHHEPLFDDAAPALWARRAGPAASLKAGRR